MADMNSTLARPATRARVAPRATTRTKAGVQACAPIPAYGAGDGVLSFRHGLRARERGVIDRALEIVGGKMRESQGAYPTSGAIKAYLQLQLGGEQSERFAVLFLDCGMRIIAFETMFVGTLAQTSVYPREVVLAALRHGAARVVLSHNHPSGSAQPSRADEALTRTLKAALALIDVCVVDHVIVTKQDTFSMAERGLL